MLFRHGDSQQCRMQAWKTQSGLLMMLAGQSFNAE
jgi:hypothetical protein